MDDKRMGEESMRALKARLRREGTRRRDALTLEERIRKSSVICRTLMEDPAWKRAEAVLTYMNFRSEVITDSLVKAALNEGRKVYAPRIMDSGISGAMEFFRITD
ncbi:MAG: 5-formyltetrahydrofolate cyclo-ligase, partial [bacterium]